MENKKFHCAATIDNISTRTDKSIKITISTQELPPDEAALLMGFHQKIGWLLFSETPMTEKDIPETKPEFKNDRSPSARLRANLFVFWDKCTNKSIKFDDFWRDWVDLKCEEIKSNIN